jgi:DNA end-binding protein Ku
MATVASTWKRPNRSSKLTLTFGLVNVPVSMKPLCETRSPISGKMTCPEHGPVLKQQYVCSQGNPEEHVIPRDQIVKSYPHPDDPRQMVVLDPSVVEEFMEQRSGFATIEKVIDASTIDPAYFESTTYLVWPGDGGDLGFDLLANALRNNGWAAVTTVVLTKKTRMLVFRWSDEFGCLLGHVVRFASEIRESDVQLVREGDSQRGTPPTEHLEMAQSLLGSLAGTFDPSDVEDTYTTLMAHAIRQAADGKTFSPEVEAPVAPAADLMAALVASIKATGEKKTTGRKPTTRKKVKA